MSDVKYEKQVSTIDIEEELLSAAIIETQGRDYTDEEIEHLALELPLDEFQALQIEIHDELFQSGLGWDERANWDAPYHPDDDEDTKATLRLKREVQLYAASCFVQYKRKYIDVETHVELSDLEIFRALSQKIAAKFQKWYKSKKLLHYSLLKCVINFMNNRKKPIVIPYISCNISFELGR